MYESPIVTALQMKAVMLIGTYVRPCLEILLLGRSHHGDRKHHPN